MRLGPKSTVADILAAARKAVVTSKAFGERIPFRRAEATAKPDPECQSCWGTGKLDDPDGQYECGCIGKQLDGKNHG